MLSTQDKIHVLSRAVVLDQDKVLLCKTLDLKNNFYFLPGGHVEHGESVENTLLRELKEETGLDFKIKRFLGCLEYSFEPNHSSICHNHEYNFIFEANFKDVKPELVKSLEEHLELIWVPISDLSKIDFRAEPLRKLLPDWLSGTLKNTLASEMI